MIDYYYFDKPKKLPDYCQKYNFDCAVPQICEEEQKVCENENKDPGVYYCRVNSLYPVSICDAGLICDPSTVQCQGRYSCLNGTRVCPSGVCIEGKGCIPKEDVCFVEDSSTIRDIYNTRDIYFDYSRPFYRKFVCKCYEDGCQYEILEDSKAWYSPEYKDHKQYLYNCNSGTYPNFMYFDHTEETCECFDDDSCEVKTREGLTLKSTGHC